MCLVQLFSKHTGLEPVGYFLNTKQKGEGEGRIRTEDHFGKVTGFLDRISERLHENSVSLHNEMEVVLRVAKSRIVIDLQPSLKTYVTKSHMDSLGCKLFLFNSYPLLLIDH